MSCSSKSGEDSASSLQFSTSSQVKIWAKICERVLQISRRVGAASLGFIQGIKVECRKEFFPDKKNMKFQRNMPRHLIYSSLKASKEIWWAYLFVLLLLSWFTFSVSHERMWQYKGSHLCRHINTSLPPQCLCCWSSSTCGYYRSHLSLALCVISLLPHWRADRFYSSVVPRGNPGTHTYIHCPMPYRSFIHTYLCWDVNSITLQY